MIRIYDSSLFCQFTLLISYNAINNITLTQFKKVLCQESILFRSLNFYKLLSLEFKNIDFNK